MSEHVDVLIVGAGLSGIGAACRLRRDSPDTNFTVLEARSTSGGTWDLFRFPGVRSDSDMFTLGYDFRPWSRQTAVAGGPAILQYIQDTAHEYGIDGDIRYGHRVVTAEWSSDATRWKVTARLADGRSVELTCSFLFVCSGYYTYDAGFTPDFAGLDDFTGRVVHPQHWPEDLDVESQRVLVVGSGATAVTLVPALADRGAQVTMLQRSPSYVASIPSRDPLAGRLLGRVPDRIAHPILRWKHILIAVASYQLSRRRPATMRRILRRATTRQLPEGFDVARHFTPTYPPWDQRLCLVPDGDLFASLRSGRAAIVTDRIAQFCPTGVELVSGRRLDADIVVTATGLNLLAIGGMELTVDGRRIELSRTLAYKGMMLAGVPNFALTIGYTNSSWTLRADLVAGYLTRLITHMKNHGFVTVTPRAPTVIDPEQLAPLIDLKSGYVLRNIDALPRQGPAWPWTLPQNYLRDIGLMRRGPIDDAVLFSRAGAPHPTGTATITVDGLAVRYRDTGTGDPILLVHGIGGSLEDWDPQHERLSARHRVISMDLPGFGWSDRTAEPITLRTLGRFIGSFLDAVGIDGPVHLAGNSLGGAVAMRFAADHPSRVSTLLLTAPAGLGAEVSIALRLLAIGPLARKLLRPGRSAAIRGLQGIFRDRSFITEDRIDAAVTRAARPQVAATMTELLGELGTFRGVRRGWREQLLEQLRPHRIPTLVVWGENDLILPATHLQAARQTLSAGEFHLLADCGHMPQIERADDFAALALDFVAEHTVAEHTPAEHTVVGSDRDRDSDRSGR